MCAVWLCDFGESDVSHGILPAEKMVMGEPPIPQKW
jgi:hypothetical protein